MKCEDVNELSACTGPISSPISTPPSLPPHPIFFCYLAALQLVVLQRCSTFQHYRNAKTDFFYVTFVCKHANAK